MRPIHIVAAVLITAACGKDEPASPAATTEPTAPAAKPAPAAAKTEPAAAPAEPGEMPADPAAMSAKLGVEPGALAYDAADVAAAVLYTTDGTVEIRRTGAEAFEAVTKGAALHHGDQVRTGDGAAAMVTFPDESTAVLAEGSALAIGGTGTTADPASSAGVLYGVVRFTVSPRAPGEGAFLAHGPSSVIATKGTVYVVGVIATGVTRIGVEEGEIEVAGAAKLDTPIGVRAGTRIEILPTGVLGAPAPAGEPDWGGWRDDAEAELDVAASAKLHAASLVRVQVEADRTYQELEVHEAALSAAELRAQAALDAGDRAAYVEVQPTLAAEVEASFALGLRAQLFTFGIASHEYVVRELYARHPADLEVEIAPLRPRLAASALYNKKLVLVVDDHVAPLRPAYYRHHPVGRAHAVSIGYEVPGFYADVHLDVDAPVRGGGYYRPPVIHASGPRRIRYQGPEASWTGRVKVRGPKVRAGWYVRPKAPRSRAIVGARVTGRIDPVFDVRLRVPRAKASIRIGGGEVRDHRAGGRVVGGGRVHGGAAIRDHRQPGRGAEVRDHRAGDGPHRDRERGSSTRVQRVKRDKPEKRGGKVRGKVELKGRLKIGD